MQSGRTILTLATAIAAIAAPAAAQDPPVRVQVVVPVQIGRQVTREVAREVTRDVQRAITRELRDLPRVQALIQVQRQQGRQALRAEASFRETRTLKIGANGMLELHNLAGDISVMAGGNDVRVEILKEARGRTEADARRGLDEVRVNVESQGDRGSVRAVYPEHRDQGQRAYSVSIGYTVTAPPGTRLTISTLSGDVVVRDIKGDISASVTSGDITISGAGHVSSVRAISGDVVVRDATSPSGVTAGTLSGTVLLERVKAPRIAVDVTGGDIILRDVTAENAQLKTLSGDVEFTGPIARGGRYELQTHSGDVVLTPTAGGFQLQAQTFSGTITPPAGSELRVANRQRSLRGTVGDGSATVMITTFSGDVRIGRK